MLRVVSLWLKLLVFRQVEICWMCTIFTNMFPSHSISLHFCFTIVSHAHSIIHSASFKLFLAVLFNIISHTTSTKKKLLSKKNCTHFIYCYVADGTFVIVVFFNFVHFFLHSPNLYPWLVELCEPQFLV